jgi:DNA-binding MarR family transcriptional regulator
MKRYLKYNLDLDKQINKELTLKEHLVLSHVTGLSIKKGYCYVSNNSMVKDLKISYRSICRVLDNLEQMGLINRQTKSVGRYGRERKIYVSPSVKVAQHNK